MSATKTRTDVFVSVKWHALKLSSPPNTSGVYAVKHRTRQRWYYIGKSNNIAKRITAKNHPIQITKDIKLEQIYLYAQALPEHIGWLENYLIRELAPEWNGHTSFNSYLKSGLCCDYTHFGDKEGFAEIVRVLESA